VSKKNDEHAPKVKKLFVLAGQRWAAVRQLRQPRSGNEGVPRRMGSQTEGERKKSLRGREQQLNGLRRGMRCGAEQDSSGHLG